MRESQAHLDRLALSGRGAVTGDEEGAAPLFHYDKAIEHYGNAWQHAINTIK